MEYNSFIIINKTSDKAYIISKKESRALAGAWIGGRTVFDKFCNNKDKQSLTLYMGKVAIIIFYKITYGNEITNK